MNNFENISGYTSIPLITSGEIKNINTNASSEDFEYLVNELDFIRIYNELTGEFKRLELRNRGQKNILIEPRYNTEDTADICIGVRNEQELADVLQIITELSSLYDIDWYKQA